MNSVDNPQDMSGTAWREIKYSEVFDTTAAQLHFRRTNDHEFTLDDAKRTLEHLYVADGNDWTGRGELGDIVMSATLAAWEWFIAEWEREIRSSSAVRIPGDARLEVENDS